MSGRCALVLIIHGSYALDTEGANSEPGVYQKHSFQLQHFYQLINTSPGFTCVPKDILFNIMLSHSHGSLAQQHYSSHLKEAYLTHVFPCA